MFKDNIDGIKGEGIKIISLSSQVKQIYLTLVRSANSEILLIFPSINAIRREERIGILEELRLAAKRGIRVRILTPEDEFIRNQLDMLRANGANVKKIESSSESKFKLLIIDKKFSLIIETNDDSKSEFLDAIGLATLSNSKPTVEPFVTIFNGFWKEAEVSEKARHAERAKDEFVNIAAHELRTPIMPIVTSIELLKEDIDELMKNTIPNTKIKENIDSNLAIILRNSSRLLQLSEDILQVSRIESGTFMLNIESVDLNSLINFAVNDIKKKYLEEKTQVKFFVESKLNRAPDDSFMLFCDRSKITQALFNLLDNATKFTSEGVVEISSSHDNSHILITIKDSGPGVDPAIKDRLFEKFTSRSERGTGLGLYITRKIVEAHGGKIWASGNVDGTGTTFMFTLPTDLQSTYNKLKHESELSVN